MPQVMHPFQGHGALGKPSSPQSSALGLWCQTLHFSWQNKRILHAPWVPVMCGSRHLQQVLCSFVAEARKKDRACLCSPGLSLLPGGLGLVQLAWLDPAAFCLFCAGCPSLISLQSSASLSVATAFLCSIGPSVDCRHRQSKKKGQDQTEGTPQTSCCTANSCTGVKEGACHCCLLGPLSCSSSGSAC